jgi:putative heme degradation protein
MPSRWLDLRLRADHVAEVRAVGKPTKRGAALSVECFDAEGALIAVDLRNDQGEGTSAGGLAHHRGRRA